MWLFSGVTIRPKRVKSRSNRSGGMPTPVSVTLILTCTVLTFVPTPYLYATRGGPFAAFINVGAVLWFVVIGLVLRAPAGASTWLAVASLMYPLTYLAGKPNDRKHATCK